MLLIELAGDTDRTESLAEALEDAELAGEPAVGMDAVASQRLWQVRESVGEVLGATEGVAIASRAQLLGTYDVSYEGASFLVRVSAVDAGAYVSAVDPRGLPATGAAPTKLLAALKAKLGG